MYGSSPIQCFGENVKSYRKMVSVLLCKSRVTCHEVDVFSLELRNCVCAACVGTSVSVCGVISV